MFATRCNSINFVGLGKQQPNKKRVIFLTFNQGVMGSSPIEITLNINGL